MKRFEDAAEKDGFRFKLWRGERMAMLGFDVAEPESDLVGFALEVRSPGSDEFVPLRNRLAFGYPTGAATAVTGDRQFPTTEAPIQKFRWVHFPWMPKDGEYRYRATKMHMPRDLELVSGSSIDLGIDLSSETHEGFLDVGFTRNFASSQAYREQFGNNAGIIPRDAADGLDFAKLDIKNKGGVSVYDWLGFEAKALIYDFLERAALDKDVTIHALAYDLNEPGIVERLEKLGSRLMVVIDDSSSRDEDGEPNGHDLPGSCESRSADRFEAAGAEVRRTHFHNLQHHKVFIQLRKGVPEKVLCGSTNFSFRGLYIQSNNVLVFSSRDIADLFETMFNGAFHDPRSFRGTAFAKTWHVVWS